MAITGLPGDFSTRTFADDFLDDRGGPIGGVVTFTLNNVVAHVGGGPTILPVTLTVPVDPTTGHLSVELLVTDDSDYTTSQGGVSNGYLVSYAGLTDPTTGRTLKRRPDDFTLTVESALPNTVLQLRTKAAYVGPPGSLSASRFVDALIYGG